MRKGLAILLAISAVLYGSPLLAEEPVRHYFNIGVHPVDPDRQISWETECKVELTEPSPTVRLSFSKNGSLGESRPGNIRAGYGVVVDKQTGFAKWVSLCGNDIVEPKNWVPVGRKTCGTQPVAASTTSSCDPSCGPAASPASEKPELPPSAMPKASAETEVDAKAPAAQPAPTPTPAPRVEEKKGDGTFWKVMGGAVLGAGITLGICALTKHCDFSRHHGDGQNGGGGGPSPDPPNGPGGNPPN